MSFGPPPSTYTQSTYTQSTLTADHRRGKRRKALLKALAAVLATVLAAVAWLFSGRDSQEPDKPVAAEARSRLDVRQTVENRPASTTGVMAFRFSADDMSPGEQYGMPGMWATDKILAKGVNRSIAGFAIGTDAAPRDEKWKVQFAGPICGYTLHVTGDNRTAVLFKASQDEDALCDHVAFIDLDDGRKVWEHAFTPVKVGGYDGTPSTSSLQATPGVTLTHATVAVTWGGGSEAYDMDNGRQLWRTTATGKCQDDGAAGGGALLIRVSCFQSGKPLGASDGITYQVRKVDPRTGRTLWTYSAAPGVRDIRVPSAEPPVLAVSAGDIAITELLSLDGKGRNRATIRLQNGQYVGECTFTDSEYLVIDDCPTIPVGGGQVFLRSKESDDALHPTNWIVGFDLATGNTVKKFEAGPTSLLYPVRTSGDQLLALRKSGDFISPTGLVSLDPKTGGETPYYYFNLPPEAESFTITDMNDVIIQNGRLFFGAKRATGPSKEQGKAWVWFVLGIESSAAKSSAAKSSTAKSGAAGQ